MKIQIQSNFEKKKKKKKAAYSYVIDLELKHQKVWLCDQRCSTPTLPFEL